MTLFRKLLVGLDKYNVSFSGTAVLFASSSVYFNSFSPCLILLKDILKDKIHFNSLRYKETVNYFETILSYKVFNILKPTLRSPL